MCLACIDYIKGNMKLSEYKSALRESAQIASEQDHAKKVQTIIYDHNADEETLKAKIKEISDDKK